MILQSVRWYLAYSLSYRDLEEIMSEISKTTKSNKIDSGNLYQSEYETARVISKFMSFIGWLFFAAGIFSSAFAGTVSSLQSDYNGGTIILALLPGLGLTVSGLFLVAAGQVTRATVDNADHTREILRVIRKKS